METFIEIFVTTLFAGGVVCFISAVILVTIADQCLTPEAPKPPWWWRRSSLVSGEYLTPGGRLCRRMALKSLLWAVSLVVIAMVGGALLMLVFGIKLEPAKPRHEKVMDGGTGR